jgi:hypothetical protein
MTMHDSLMITRGLLGRRELFVSQALVSLRPLANAVADRVDDGFSAYSATRLSPSLTQAGRTALQSR